MLYLINETFYNKDTKEIIDILKIGYTSDNNKPGSRFTSYLNHCPEAKLLYEIPGGTLDHESALLNKFHHLLYKGQEWFKYSQEIIDYFETHRDLESLSDLSLPDIQYSKEIKDYCNKCLNLLLHERVTYGELSLEQATNSVKPMLDVLLSKRFKNSLQIDKYFLSVFDFDTHKIDTKLDKITEFLVKFDSYTRFTDKMKFLYDISFILSDEEMDYVLNSVHMIYKNYFTVLGRDRIRALQFRKYALDAEYERLYGNQDKKVNLKTRIYSNFIINNRYSSVYIKETLGKIYEFVGIKSSPKATDIENYFEVKKIQIINKESGKKDRGYLIIKKKE